MSRRIAVVCLLIASAASLFADDWTLKHRVEIRANYRDSKEEFLPLKTVFPPGSLPPGQTAVFLRTPDPGTQFELSVAQLQLDLGYGSLLAARAKIHAQDKYRRNPTSSDRKIDADELWVRFGVKPEFLDRPEKTSFFLQLGKAPRMERQPIRLLESYGLAATSFNRFEDVQALFGGSVGRNFYWRLQVANGNPLFFRDPNSLAGDNGTPEIRDRKPPKYGSGFPILYNAEVEELFFNSDHLQFGQAVGYRWQREDQTFGYDVILFHYRRSLADEKNLTGTFYGGDLDLLSAMGVVVPTHGRTKEEYGGRVYSEWHGLTAIGQFTKQQIAGLQREGFEVEAGYRIPLAFGPHAGAETLLQSVQPVVRVSGLTNRFNGPAEFPAPSIWWNWKKIDYGVRIGFARNVDLTIEHAKHSITAKKKLHPDETLATLRIRI
jgi:hypothetical protein